MLYTSLGVSQKGIISFIGGGGKTSAIRKISRELTDAAQKCIITTTTRIAGWESLVFKNRILAKTWPELKASLPQVLRAQDPLLVGSCLMGDKMMGIPPEWVNQIQAIMPEVHILVEADGAAKKLFKAPGFHEPVIPIKSHLVVGVVGIRSLGLPLNGQNFHRPELIAELTGCPLGEPLSMENLIKVITHPQGYKKNLPMEALLSILINQAEDDQEIQLGKELAAKLKEKGINRVVLASVQSLNPVKGVW